MASDTARRTSRTTRIAPRKRCAWPSDDALMIAYHDDEWGYPVHDDRKLFEYLVLDAFQAGLSWRTILHKRENFRKAFRDFDPKKIAKFTNRDFERLMNDEGIIRNRLKIQASITNAQRFLDVQKEFGTFDKFIWQFTGGKTVHNGHRTIRTIPAKTALSDEMSKELIRRGFKFVGSTICYSFMQAAGMVNDHTVDCFRYKQKQSPRKKS
jgi:DNA-3-methyladenine glycosylase I